MGRDRHAYSDHLTTHRFWLFDAAPMDPLAVPVLSPLYGFQSITAPEVTMETEDIQECNWPFPRKVLTKGSLNALTLTRGATIADADFWRWIKAAIHGNVEAMQSRGYGVSHIIASGGLNFGDAAAAGLSSGLLVAASMMALMRFPRVGGPTFRRSLVLMQFMPNVTTSSAGSPEGATVLDYLNAGSVAGPTAIFGGAFGAKLAFDLATAAVSFGGGVELAQAMAYERVPARAWVLNGVLPVRYKVAGDFDATSPAVSIMELDIVYEGIQEISIATG